MVATNLILTAILILATAFFVAAEFALVKIRPTRINQLVAQGKKGALAAQKTTSNLDGYLSACQLGITLTSLGLGWLAEPTFVKLIHPLFEHLQISETVTHIIATIISFAVVTFLHVVVGELTPKTIAIQKSEAIALLLSPILTFFYKVMYPFIWVLNGAARVTSNAMGFKTMNGHGDDVPSEEEVLLIMADSVEHGEMSETKHEIVTNVFSFDDTIAREVMVPRVDMVVVDQGETNQEIFNHITQEGYTRYPVINDSKDEILGFINAKDFFVSFIQDQNFDISSIIRPVMTISSSTPIRTVLATMQKNAAAMAMLIDEYGGTSGLVTMEDLLEEIVGEIRDEYDTDEKLDIEIISETLINAVGKVSIEEVNESLGVELESAGAETIGGFLMQKNAELQAKETYLYENIVFTVVERDSTRYKRIMIEKTQTP